MHIYVSFDNYVRLIIDQTRHKGTYCSAFAFRIPLESGGGWSLDLISLIQYSKASSTSLYLEWRILILFLPALILSARILSEFFFQVQTVLAGKSNSSQISWRRTLSYRILRRISAFLDIDNWFLHNRFGLCIVGFAPGFLGGLVILAEICCWSWFDRMIENM